jgi:hypothetical protein
MCCSLGSSMYVIHPMCLLFMAGRLDVGSSIKFDFSGWDELGCLDERTKAIPGLGIRGHSAQEEHFIALFKWNKQTLM